MVELPKAKRNRVERQPQTSPYAHHQEDSLAWAVSYADLLMVLLSFFVLFFSFGQNQKDSVIKKILLSKSLPVQVSGKPLSFGDTTPNSKDSKVSEARTRMLEDLKNFSTDLKVTKIIQGEVLILMLPDDSYPSGQLELTSESSELFKSTLQKLLQYKDQIHITLVGFSDGQAVKKKKQAAIQNNFDLSALRATRAVQAAIALGFDQDQLQAKGSSHFGRESRTLSIQVSMRGAQ